MLFGNSSLTLDLPVGIMEETPGLETERKGGQYFRLGTLRQLFADVPLHAYWGDRVNLTVPCVSPVGAIIAYLVLLIYFRNYMNDSLKTNVFGRFPPETIACACIYLTARQLEVGDFGSILKWLCLLYCIPYLMNIHDRCVPIKLIVS